MNIRILLAILLCLALLGCAKETGSPFSCNLKALTEDERRSYAELSRQLAAGVAESRELGNGYAFRLDPALPLASAAQWMEFESRCCPFFDFKIEKAREGGAVWLHLTGRDGVKDFIRTEFGMQ